MKRAKPAPKRTPDRRKLFVVRKYVRALSVSEAIRLERKQEPDDVFVDQEWKSGQAAGLSRAIGFGEDATAEDDDD